MDIMTPEQRRKVMRNIKSKDTSIELKLRKELWRRGYRYRKNYKALPGTPDIALTKYKIAVFCDSEFFHGYKWEEKKPKLQTNKEFWIKKINRNIERDNSINQALRGMGWVVIRFWGHEITKDIESCIHVIEDEILERLKEGIIDEDLDIK